MEKIEQLHKEKNERPTGDIETAIETIGNSIEISPTLDDTIAICVIKPDAFLHRDDIVRRLESSGLYIVQRTPKQLGENFVVHEMYGKDALPKPLEDAHIRHFLSGESEIIIVKGDNVVRKLLDTVGLKTNPALCDPETIRYIYGDLVPEELEQGLKYFRNAAHRPTSNEEAREDLNKFSKII
ncbi:MAG: nucleoside-diphosphate kinase [bacterium]